MLMWLLIAVFLRLMSWIQNTVSQDYHEDIDDRHTWSDVMLLIAGTLGEQGSDLSSRWVTWRLVFLTMLVLTVLLNNYYGACVVSSLLSETPLTIRTVRHLIDSPLRFGAEDNNYNRKFLEFDSDPTVHELYRKKMAGRRDVYSSREEGVRKMLRDQFAFHVEVITVYPLIETTFPDSEKCSLTEVTVYPTVKSYVSVPFKSPFQEILTSG
ncbi:ionotropic receptor 75a-like [Bacillus rossius redtenbacheri]|uniref:ionotropic receptor 75a-like n=1 Tax=Bacillus rossius redtenbacheri TaxID=93214 RepID=UPI002FDD1741